MGTPGPWMPRRITLPLQPLLDVLGPRGYTIVEAYNTDIERWERRGLQLDTADRVAVRLAGKHPWEIWGDDWWRDLLDEPLPSLA